MTRCSSEEKTPRSGRGLWSLLASVAVMAAMVVPLTLVGQTGVASAAAAGPATCGTAGSGTPASLAGGSYTTVTVAGNCLVNTGEVVTSGDVTVQPGAVLTAVFADNSGGSGSSGLTVGGNLIVQNSGSLIMGCGANPEIDMTCEDDSNGNATAIVQGNIEAPGALGVIVHNATIGGDVVETGGGGGFNCNDGSDVSPAFGYGFYSDYESSSIGGNLRVTGVTSCWFGALRVQVGGSATFANNTFADPDASETTNNQVAGNLLCSGNNPATQYGDAGASPNVVGGYATDECAFGVMSPNPDSPSGNPAPISTPSTTPRGYWMAGADGGIFSYGVPFFGSQSGTALSQPITGIAAVPGGNNGYNLAEGNGMVYAERPTRYRLREHRCGAQPDDCEHRRGARRERLLARRIERRRRHRGNERTVLRLGLCSAAHEAHRRDWCGTEQ